jgi:hypothetical protein
MVLHAISGLLALVSLGAAVTFAVPQDTMGCFTSCTNVDMSCLTNWLVSAWWLDVYRRLYEADKSIALPLPKLTANLPAAVHQG